MIQILASNISHYIGLTLDIVVVLVLLIFAIIGFRKGLIKSVLALFSTAVVLIISVYFANNFAKIINSIYDFAGLIADKLAPSIQKLDSVFEMTFPAGMSGTEFYSSYIANSGINTLLKKFFKFSLKGMTASSVEGLTVAEVLASSVSSVIMTIVAGILLFILIKLAIGLISRFFENITRTQILGGLNRFLGLIFGAVKGSVIIIFFILITICISFVPKLNSKIYPLVQNDTKVVKYAYNTTDKLVEKYLIKSDLISKWVNNLWNNRYNNKNSVEEPTIEDKATALDKTAFSLNGESYEAQYSDITISKTKSYLKLDKLDEITTSKVTIEISLTFEGEETIAFEMYDASNLSDTIGKSPTSTDKTFVFEQINYARYIFELNSTNENVITSITIKITPQNE